MSQAPYLTLISPVQSVERRDFSLASPAILNPTNANPLIDGEWLVLDSDYKLARGSGNQAVPNHQVFAEKGRYDTQPIGKVPVLWLGAYEAETSVYDSTGLAVNNFLMVADVTISSLTRKGLKEATSATWVVGMVTRVLTGKIRFVKFASGWVLA